MARKQTVAHVPAQMGFGFEVCDAQGASPPFLYKSQEVREALELIERANWASVDVETTGLTDASVPVSLGRLDYKQDASSVVRMRTIQARVPAKHPGHGPRVNFAFDCDKLSKADLISVANTILSRKMFIAHNAGFDLYWLRRAGNRQVMPEIVVDTMLLTRLLQPQLVLKRAELTRHVRVSADVVNEPDVVRQAWKSMISGASGGSLADVVLAMFGVVVDKTYQKPNNWIGLLGFEHYDYAIDDVIWADKILSRLLLLESEGDLYEAYIAERDRKSTIRLVEPQVPELVLLREKGMPFNEDIARRYVIQKRTELAIRVAELIALEPSLEVHKSALADPDAGRDAALTKALAAAFEARGVVLRKTAAEGVPQIGEKDLRACRAVQMESSRPLFNAWVAVCRLKKSSSMALEVCGFAERSGDSRVHSLLSHGPVTGRLSASEPNCFTGDTEILTGRGWVRFDELTPKEKVMQYVEGGLSLVEPSVYIKHHYSGPMVHSVSDVINQLTTPDHRCLVLDANGTEVVVPATDYKQGKVQLHAAEYKGGSGIPLSEVQLQLFGLLQGYGRWTHRGYVVTLDFADQDLINRMDAICESLGISVKGHKSKKAAQRYVFKPDQPDFAAIVGIAGNSLELGPWVLDLTASQFAILASEFVYLGSRERQVFSGSHYRVAQKNQADWIQVLMALSNRLTLLRNEKEWSDRRALWDLKTWSTSKSSITDAALLTKLHHGLVYCVTVPSGFIMVRRQGCVMITGNCQQWPRDQLFRAMCISGVLPGEESIAATVTEETATFFSACTNSPVAVGTEVSLPTQWVAAMLASDKSVSAWSQETRDSIERRLDEKFTHTIVASDFGALDVRVGSALCIRAQREMLALAGGHAVPGPIQPNDEVIRVVKDVVGNSGKPNALALLADRLGSYKADTIAIESRLKELSEDLESAKIGRHEYFTKRTVLKDALLRAKIGWRLAQCLLLGLTNHGELEYSALRDAFVADIDIHTFTGMKLAGRDPMAEFGNLSRAERKAYEKKLKKELGPKRQQGKIANLSLLYGMADAGFQEAAARGYDEHWTLEEAGAIRSLWMDAYPEVELWHLWTECLQAGTVYVAEQGRDKPVRSGWWMARTLANRDIVAFGLNAALSYQDQSSGADILGMIMHTLKTKHPAVFATAVNQVHDEVVFEVPKAYYGEYLPIIEYVMVEEANKLTMPYGVPCAVSPACGNLWIKD